MMVHLSSCRKDCGHVVVVAEGVGPRAGGF